jgi:hypothetical protein
MIKEGIDVVLGVHPGKVSLELGAREGLYGHLKNYNQR